MLGKDGAHNMLADDFILRETEQLKSEWINVQHIPRRRPTKYNAVDASQLIIGPGKICRSLSDLVLKSPDEF